jgi:hypothetical protein
MDGDRTSTLKLKKESSKTLRYKGANTINQQKDIRKVLLK